MLVAASTGISCILFVSRRGQTRMEIIRFLPPENCTNSGDDVKPERTAPDTITAFGVDEELLHRN